MYRSQQLRHAAGLVIQAVALRSALTSIGSTSQEDIVFRLNRLWGRLLCLLNQHHDETFLTDDNEPYQRCVRCNRDFYFGPGGGAIVGPSGGCGV